MDGLIAALDAVMPGRHSLAVALVGALTAVAAGLVWLSRLLLLWRKDQRDARESIAVLMGHLIDQQRAELQRLTAEADGLRRQIGQLAEGRLQVQRAVDHLRDQIIAARMLVHDYERRLGLQETRFEALPALAVIPSS